MDPRYPIGLYEPQPFSDAQLSEWLNDIRVLPQLLADAVLPLDEAQLDTPYREGGWTVKQLVHHIADSHINAITRFKLGLTEHKPVIKPYDENAWVQLNDVKELPVTVSLRLLEALHARWYSTLRELPPEAFLQRAVVHPQQEKEMSIWYLLGMYAWHGRHHVAHITRLHNKMNG
ncbi:MAG: putative metal-dependent hydrolase [Flavihumibacter sp.]